MCCYHLDEPILIFSSLKQTSGHWDNGKTQIEAYLQGHQCNIICRGLNLHLENIPNDTERLDNEREDSIQSRASTHPLQFGFD